MKPKRILCVEDHGLVRAGMRSLLMSSAPGAEVLEAKGYADGLALVAAHDVDLAFLDLDLKAQRTGLDLLRTIRDEGHACKVVMVSATEDRDTILECISSGASGYILKSAEEADVLSVAIHTVLEGGVYLPQSLINADPSTLASVHEPGHADAIWAQLPPRLRQVLYHLCQGYPNKKIAQIMDISEGTVRKNYVSELLRIFGVSRRTELMIRVAKLRMKIPAPHMIPAP